MRYDTPIYFQALPERVYDEETGDYTTPEPVEDMRFASVQDTSEAHMNLIYGGIRQGSLIIQIQNHYLNPFQYIRIGSKRYQVDSVRKQRFKHVFVVSEVQ